MAQASTTQTTTAPVEMELKKKVPAEKFRKDYKPPLFFITRAELDFSLGFEETTVNSTVTIHRAPASPAGIDLVLHGEDLILKQVKLNGNELKISSPLDGASERECYTNSDGELIVAGRLLPAKAEEKFVVETTVKINPSANLALMGLFKSGTILCTQCEAEGFRRITFFLDRPDVMATFRVRLQANKATFPVLLSNGNKVESGDLENDSHYAIYDDPFLKPCYLFALVAGDLASLSDTYQHPKKPEGKKVALHIWAEREQIPKLAWSMESIKRAMQWDEDVFGLEYDLDLFNIVSVRDFNMGAMENKSLNVFVSALLLASPATSTDLDYERILSVVGHEYFHNWTGDRVTCRDWFQLTLKEGLTVFRDQQFSADMGSPAVQRIESVIGLRARQFPEDSGPMSHPIRPESYIAMDNFYTSTVYQKGAEVIRMYHTILGATGFRKGMDLYFKRHDGQAVTCDDFRAAMADANGQDFTQLERWYTQSGTPVVTVADMAYDEKNMTYRFKVKQHIPPSANQQTKLPMHIPLAVGLIGKNSKKEIKATEVLHFVNAEQEFVIENVSEEPHLSILRNFSAPVTLIHEQSDDELAFQMGYDTDPFNKWDAGQTLMQRILLDRANKIRTNEIDPASPPALPEIFIQAFRSLLQEPDLDGSFKAYALVPPTQDLLANYMRPCCPIAVHAARDGLRRQICAALRSEFNTMYNKLSDELKDKPYAVLPSSENVAPRQLRNLILSYLAGDRTEESAKLASEHFKNAKNMTDKIAAMRCLMNIKCAEKDEAIQKFYEDAAGDDLVLDKWFGIQAGAETDDLMEQVKKLKQHEKFTMKTPSRMRAVFFRFAMNFPHFHRTDGEGYKLVADAVLEVDEFNGSIAARLANYLIDWKNYEESRQKQIKGELQRIMDCGRLKPETYEIVKKGLEA